MNRKYSIDCSLNDEYKTRIQIEMRLSYDRHDDEVDDDVNVDR